MKKTVLLFIALMPLWAMAQNTAEAIFALCPPLPAQSRLVGYGVGAEGDADVAAVEQFLDRLDKAIEQAKRAAGKRGGALDAPCPPAGNAALRSWTGRWERWTKRLPALAEELDGRWVSEGYHARCEAWWKRRVPPEYVRSFAPRNSVEYWHARQRGVLEYYEEVKLPAVRAIEREYLDKVSVREWYPFILEGLNLLKQRRQIAGQDDATAAECAIRYLEYARKLAEFPRGGVKGRS